MDTVKLKLVSAPPLMLTINGEKRALDVSFRDPLGRIVALPTARHASPIVIGAPDGAADVWQAWRTGFRVEDSSTARQVASQLVAAGVAIPA